jgi:hypothetical protein
MLEKAYLSNLCAAWPIERQQAVLGERNRVYLDKLSAKAIRNGDTKAMKERAAMLRPTSRQEPERIVVASFRCLAATWQDFAGVIASAAARNATLHALDTGVTIEPHAAGQLVADEIAAFGRAVRRGGKGRTPEEIAEERRADTLRRIDLIREDWPKPEPSTAELLARAGVKPGKPMAPATARAHLGNRPKVQHAYQMEQNRQAGRDAGATPGRKPKA